MSIAAQPAAANVPAAVEAKDLFPESPEKKKTSKKAKLSAPSAVQQEVVEQEGEVSDAALTSLAAAVDGDDERVFEAAPKAKRGKQAKKPSKVSEASRRKREEEEEEEEKQAVKRTGTTLSPRTATMRNP